MWRGILYDSKVRAFSLTLQVQKISVLIQYQMEWWYIIWYQAVWEKQCAIFIGCLDLIVERYLVSDLIGSH